MKQVAHVAQALSAKGIAMGTRFMTTKGSLQHENYKNLSLEQDICATLYSKILDIL